MSKNSIKEYNIHRTLAYLSIKDGQFLQKYSNKTHVSNPNILIVNKKIFYIDLTQNL